MRRWGQIAEARSDEWYQETATQVYRPDIYLRAARQLVEEGNAQAADFPFDTDGYRAPTREFIDGLEYDGRRPNAYLKQFAIGLKGDQKVPVGRVATE